MTAPLATRVAGPEGAPAVVLLHAIATSSALWEPQIATWAETLRVVAVDLPGHGASPLTQAPPSLDSYAQAVLATMDALDVERAALVGLSLGSSISQRLAVQAPERVRAVVLAAGAAYSPPPAQAMWRGRADDARAHGVGGQVEAILERWFTAEFRASAPTAVERIKQLVLSTSTEGYVAAAEIISTLDNRSLLGRIACPTLVVAGEHDKAIPLEALKHIAEAIPNSRLASVPAAHLLNIEAAAVVTDLVGRFLATTLTSSSHV